MAGVPKRDRVKVKTIGVKLKKSIEKAARAARVPDDRLINLVADVVRDVMLCAEHAKHIRPGTIRKTVLAKLRVVDPALARAWGVNGDWNRDDEP